MEQRARQCKQQGRTGNSVLLLSLELRLKQYSQLSAYISEYIAVNVADALKMVVRTVFILLSMCLVVWQLLIGCGGLNQRNKPIQVENWGHDLPPKIVAVLFLINGWSPVSTILQRLMEGNPRSKLLVPYLRMLAQLTTAKLSHRDFTISSWTDSRHAASTVPLLVMNLKSDKPVLISFDVLEPLLQRLRRADLEIMAGIPELVQFPEFTRDSLKARALLEAIERLLPEIVTSPSYIFKARSACTRVVLRCFLLVVTHTQSQQETQEGQTTEPLAVIETLLAEDALTSPISMLKSVSPQALRDFCGDMMTILLTADDFRDNNMGRIPLFATLFWYCVACATSHGVWFVANVLTQNFRGPTSRFRMRQLHRSRMSSENLLSNGSGAEGMCTSTLEANWAGLESQESTHGDKQLKVALRIVDIFCNLLHIQSFKGAAHNVGQILSTKDVVLASLDVAHCVIEFVTWCCAPGHNLGQQALRRSYQLLLSQYVVTLNAPHSSKEAASEGEQILWTRLRSVVCPCLRESADYWLKCVPSNFRSSPSDSQQFEGTQAPQATHLRHALAVLLHPRAPLSSDLGAAMLSELTSAKVSNSESRTPGWLQSLQLLLLAKQRQCAGAVCFVASCAFSALIGKIAHDDDGLENLEDGFASAVWRPLDCLLGNDVAMWQETILLLDAMQELFDTATYKQKVLVAMSQFRLSSHFQRSQAYVEHVATTCAQWNPMSRQKSSTTNMVPLHGELCAKFVRAALTLLFTQLACRVPDFDQFMELVPIDGSARFYLPLVEKVH